MNTNVIPLSSSELEHEIKRLQNLIDIDALQIIIDINTDASEFYTIAAATVESSKLRRSFSALFTLHQKTKITLQRLLQKKRVSINRTSALITGPGTTVDIFGAALTTLSSKVDTKLITSLENAENRCLHSLHVAADQESLSFATRKIIKQEIRSLKTTHYFMQELKHAAQAA